ncbi:hypothetical protein EXIGLDRAFT_717538, partial [Exidia glandulosa HHB12029]
MSLKNHRSSASLRPAADDGGMDDGGPPVSLAHELAAALMPEPSMTSRLLADEFGLEFDEGAEGGVDDGAGAQHTNGATVDEPGGHSLQDELDPAAAQGDDPFEFNEAQHDEPVVSAEDQLEQLTKDLTTTETFLTTLRRLDLEDTSQTTRSGHARQGSVSNTETTLEGVAAAVIRRLNDSVREREGQVRELHDFNREFVKIASEVGGMDVLGEVDMLEHIEGLELPSGRTSRPAHPGRQDSLETRMRLDDLREEEDEPEIEEPDEMELEQEEDEYGAPASPTLKRRQTDTERLPKPPPQSTAPPSAARALPELAYMRTLTGSVVASLSAVSEHAQVGGAAAADAGRKLRALRNRITTWRAEYESAERSRTRIEQWEKSRTRAPNARVLMQAEVTAFERVLADANSKTQAIRASPAIAASS